MVTFGTEMLFQGKDDHVVITLLKDEIEDSKIDDCESPRKDGSACLWWRRGRAQPIFLFSFFPLSFPCYSDTYQQVSQCSFANRKGKGFQQTTLQGSNSKCFKCGKTVYAAEYVGAGDKAFHVGCFRCVRRQDAGRRRVSVW